LARIFFLDRRAMSKEKTQLESHFADPEAYDQRIRKYVPYYEEMMKSLLDCLPELEHHPTVLELGCGTGNLSLKLLDKNFSCELTTIDLVKEMVRTCRTRLDPYSHRAEIFCANMITYRKDNSFDYVFSNLALHYPETNNKKMAVCRNVYQSLKPRGVFAFSAMLTSDSAKAAEETWKRWERDVIQNGVSREELEEWCRTHHRSDHPVPYILWLKWLHELGFKHCKLIWSRTIFGTIRAIKP